MSLSTASMYTVRAACARAAFQSRAPLLRTAMFHSTLPRLATTYASRSFSIQRQNVSSIRPIIQQRSNFTPRRFGTDCCDCERWFPTRAPKPDATRSKYDTRPYTSTSLMVKSAATAPGFHSETERSFNVRCQARNWTMEHHWKVHQLQEQLEQQHNSSIAK
jgi:hypothetical protein